MIWYVSWFIHSSILPLFRLLQHAVINRFTEDEALALYNELFSDTSLEVGKTLSKGERDEKNLNHEKVSFSPIA